MTKTLTETFKDKTIFCGRRVNIQTTITVNHHFDSWNYCCYNSFNNIIQYR